MTGNEFLRRLKRLGRERSVEVEYDARAGKGSHGKVRYGTRMTPIPDLRKELTRGLFHALCKQLGINPRDL